jgi:multicomponent K+:H+ antiporter subunit G
MAQMILEAVIAGFLVLGGVFGLIGSYGLLKLRDPMQRLHAPTKATTVGVGTALVASAFHLLAEGGPVTWHEALVAMFLLISAPMSALFLAKVTLLRNLDRRTLPETGTGRDWATWDRALEDEATVPERKKS